MKIQVERLRDLYPEIQPLYKRHYDEIAEVKGVAPLDPDYKRYLSMDAEGRLLTVTVRKDGELVGYFKAVIENSLHYRTTIYGITDIFFIDKEYRGGGTGKALFAFVIEEMKRRGVQVFFCAYKTKHGHKNLFESLGFTEIERHYMMILEDQG